MTNIPTRIFIVKVASRCNLACTYCYMYMHPDQTWRSQPRFMSRRTTGAVAARLQEHAEVAGLTGVMVVLHGGEPLLYPDLDYFLDTLSNKVTSCDVSFSVQTNGTMFAAESLATLRRHRVRVGVSVDGNQAAHDRRRPTAEGRSSYESVLEGLRLAQLALPDQVDSVLQVIDTSVDPSDMLDTLESYGVKRADLLFPDLNHDTFAESGLKTGELGRWLCRVFDLWVQRANSVHIRIFATIIHLLVGGRQGTDQLGAFSDGALMIETDGSYHIYDGLKTAYEGAGATSKNVYDSPVAEVEALPLARAFRDKASGAAEACIACSLFDVCGGGSPIHRYSREGAFDHPSAYCEDLMQIIRHIRDYVRSVEPTAYPHRPEASE